MHQIVLPDDEELSASIMAGRQTARASSSSGVPESKLKTSDRPMHHSVFSRFHLIVAQDCKKHNVVTDPSLHYFTIENLITYAPFCDDFGPMNLGSIFEFCKILDAEFEKFPGDSIAMSIKQSLTNAVFLIGAYMILKLGMQPSEVETRFSGLLESLLAYRDVSPGHQNFELYVSDCWSGLWRAKSLDWVDFGPDGFDLGEYSHLDDPLNADLHEICPDKFLAMRGPKDLFNDSPWCDIYTDDGQFRHRNFSPAHYVDILQQFNVQLVVRLNSPEYSKHAFTSRGIAVVDLFFEDCTTPSPAVVAKFMALSDGLPGAIAVHCKAGLGRTGTLIALYMMKHHGFSAREAMGWLRTSAPAASLARSRASCATGRI